MTAKDNRVRVLLFESAPYVQARLLECCQADNNMEVAGLFTSAKDVLALADRGAREFLNWLAPDVVVYGAPREFSHEISALRELAQMLPCKYIAFTSDNVDARDAREAGLFAYLKRPGAGNVLRENDVYTKLVYLIRNARLTAMVETLGGKGKWAALPLPSLSAKKSVELIAIGASAGGTEAILCVLRKLPADMPGIVVVQHIPRSFADMFTKNLNSSCSITVKTARDGERIVRGRAYLCSADEHMSVYRRGEGYYIRLSEGEKVSGHRPSVDVLFGSVAEAAGAAAVGVILTGMGSDGAKGLKSMREAGAYTIGQDRESSVVYGMPGAAYEMGAVAKQLPIDRIPFELVKRCMEVADE